MHSLVGWYLLVVSWFGGGGKLFLWLCVVLFFLEGVFMGCDVDVLFGLKVELDEGVPGWLFSVCDGGDGCFMNCFCSFTDCFELRILVRDGCVVPFGVDLADPGCFGKVVGCVREFYRGRLCSYEGEARDRADLARALRLGLE